MNESKVQKWQCRSEIIKAHLSSLSPEELRQIRPSYYWLRQASLEQDFATIRIPIATSDGLRVDGNLCPVKQAAGVDGGMGRCHRQGRFSFDAQ